ncbi:MAG: Uncharacterized protein G01um101430_634 [Parcubacteria group bacterium Gr01-1014_30]|nr:MAG: Uncharacterized protein G01um101430_634 [Parcubacteria group bacterium Gr01-1014_30]
MNPETRTCQNCKNEFTIEPEDFNFYEKIKVPAPTFCPTCRMQRRFAWRNERNLYRGKDRATGKEVFTGIPPHSPLMIYEIEYWRSDAWDSLQYGRSYDFSRHFFEQLKELIYAVPWPSRSVYNIKNSDYSDQAGHLKNCYLCFNLDYTEDSVYSVKAPNCKHVIDVFEVHHSELCYDSVNITECSRTFYSADCDSCLDVWFSKNLVGCNNCVGCVNLRNKSYHIFNAPYSKEDYKKKLEAMNFRSRQGVEEIKKQVYDFWLQYPVKFMRGLRNLNSTGEALRNTKNARDCYMVQDAENVKYVQMTYIGTTDSWDYSVWGNKSARMYETLVCGDECDSLRFSFDCWPACRNLEYCVACRSSADCFGCVGLKKKQYCIFNKQYSKEEYEALREKIISHMNEMPYVDSKGIVYKYGEFLPTEFSPFAFNETMLADYFPLSKDEAIAKGYKWKDPELREYQITMSAEKIPDSIDETTDEILKEILQCASCKRAFRIVRQELDFYRRIGIPLPNLCHNCRYLARFGLINRPKFYTRSCHCGGQKSQSGIYQNTAKHFHGQDPCPNEFETSYAPERPEIVYCEKCYQSEVV